MTKQAMIDRLVQDTTLAEPIREVLLTLVHQLQDDIDCILCEQKSKNYHNTTEIHGHIIYKDCPLCQGTGKTPKQF